MSVTLSFTLHIYYIIFFYKNQKKIFIWENKIRRILQCNILRILFPHGDPPGARTPDPRLKRALLYQLSQRIIWGRDELCPIQGTTFLLKAVIFLLCRILMSFKCTLLNVPQGIYNLFFFSFFSDDKYESLTTKAYKFHKLLIKNYKNNIFLVNGAFIQGDRCYQCNEEICCMALNNFLTSIHLETPGPLYPKICN